MVYVIQVSTSIITGFARFISYSSFIAVDVVVNTIYIHIVGEGGGCGADEGEGQQNGA